MKIKSLTTGCILLFFSHLFMASCTNNKQGTVIEYLNIGNYSVCDTINDTIVIYDEKNKYFALNDKKGGTLVRYWDKESFDNVEKKESFQSDGKMSRLSQGASEFTFKCYSCHSKTITKDVELKLDTTLMNSLFKKETPRVVTLNDKKYYEFINKNKHTFYFLLSPYQKTTLFEYINCERESVDEGGCAIVVN